MIDQKIEKVPLKNKTKKIQNNNIQIFGGCTRIIFQNNFLYKQFSG